MGRSHALRLAEEGAKVVVSDLSREDCQEVASEIEEKGGEALAVECDVTEKKEVEAMMDKAVEEWGRLDVLVNNAGIAQFKPFLKLEEEDWDKTLEVNLKGYFLCAQAATRVMSAQEEGGSIVNIASVAMGQQGVGAVNISHYCASKGGIAAMTESLALELAPENIRVNAVSPGLVETQMIDPIKEDKEGYQAMLERIPMGRAARVEEISEVVVFLASDKASYMTGSVVVVDGGWLAG